MVKSDEVLVCVEILHHVKDGYGCRVISENTFKSMVNVAVIFTNIILKSLSKSHAIFLNPVRKTISPNHQSNASHYPTQAPVFAHLHQ